MQIIAVEWSSKVDARGNKDWYTVFVQAANKEEANLLRAYLPWHGTWQFRINFIAVDELGAINKAIELLRGYGIEL